MAASVLTSVPPRTTFRAVTPTILTPKGFLRNKQSNKSLDLGPRSHFLIDLSKVSRGQVRDEVHTSRTFMDIEASRIELMSGGVTDRRPDPLKYDMSKKIYERQQEWRTQV
jgi:hypothetical protein